MKEKLIVIGVGSIAPEVVDFVNRYNLYDIEGFSVDEKYMNNNCEYMGKPVYPLERIEEFVESDVKIFVAISWYNYLNRYKRQKYAYLKSKGYSFANLISPLASVKCEKIGEGNWINDFVYLGYKTNIGDNNTFCCHSIVGHSTIMGSHNVLSGRAYVAGNDVIGDNNYFGMSCTVFNKLSVGNKCLVGGGSIVKKSLSDYTIVTAPDSKYHQVNEKVVEMCLTPQSVQIVNEAI